jgi:hypothetical protein
MLEAMYGIYGNAMANRQFSPTSSSFLWGIWERHFGWHFADDLMRCSIRYEYREHIRCTSVLRCGLAILSCCSFPDYHLSSPFLAFIVIADEGE